MVQKLLRYEPYDLRNISLQRNSKLEPHKWEKMTNYAHENAPAIGEAIYCCLHFHLVKRVQTENLGPQVQQIWGALDEGKQIGTKDAHSK